MEWVFGRFGGFFHTFHQSMMLLLLLLLLLLWAISLLCLCPPPTPPASPFNSLDLQGIWVRFFISLLQRLLYCFSIMPSTSTTPTNCTCTFTPLHQYSTAIYTDEVAPRWFIDIPTLFCIFCYYVNKLVQEPAYFNPREKKKLWLVIYKWGNKVIVFCGSIFPQSFSHG